MCETPKQEQQQLSTERQLRGRSALPKSSAELPPYYDDDVARRAGGIIARAAAAIQRHDKRK
jgi:hypothetical protein